MCKGEVIVGRNLSEDEALGGAELSGPCSSQQKN